MFETSEQDLSRLPRLTNKNKLTGFGAGLSSSVHSLLCDF